MTIEGTIEVGKKAIKEMAAEKEATKIAAMTPEEKTAYEAEQSKAKQAEADKAILEAGEETLDEAGKKRRAEIVESKKKSEAEEIKKLLEAKDDDLDEEARARKDALISKRAQEKAAEKEASIQRRIDEIAGELKAERAERSKDKEKIAALEAELKKIHKPETSDVRSEVKRLEAERIAQLVKEDESLERSERREMTKAELEEWMAEDLTAANEWLADRAVRRDKERSADTAKLIKAPASESDARAEALLKKQAESNARVYARHPELNVNKRITELKAKGKTTAEISEIIKNDPKCKLALEIIKEDEDKYLLSENGPEMVAAEIERRLSKQSGETQEERDRRIADEAVEAERQRLASIDEGINSTRGKGADVKMSDIEKRQWEIFQRANPKKTLADFRANQQRRKERGA